MNDIVAKVIGRYISPAPEPRAVVERGVTEFLRNSPEFLAAIKRQPETFVTEAMTVLIDGKNSVIVAAPTTTLDHESRSAVHYEVNFRVSMVDGQLAVTRMEDA